jgi:hypothetical protein
VVIDLWDVTAVGEDRKRDLDAASSFEAIVTEITARMDVLCCHVEPSQTGPAGFRRPVFCLKVTRPLFDQFFNSRVGYRAAFFRSPYEGLKANNQLLRALLPGLMASEHSAPCNEEPVFVTESLTSESAKAWLAEAAIGLCDACRGEWSHPGGDPVEIRNGRWELQACRNSAWGRTAPYLTKIRVFGGFLNDALHELIPSRKRHRAWEIHQWGWS